MTSDPPANSLGYGPVLRQAIAEGAAQADAAAPQQLALAPDLAPAPQRAAGRPVGSRHRDAELLDRALRAKGVDLLGRLAELVGTSPKELAQELGCTTLEAFDRWWRVAEPVFDRMVAKPAAVKIELGDDGPQGGAGLLHLAAVQMAAAGGAAAMMAAMGSASDPRSVTPMQVIDNEGDNGDVPTRVP